MFGCASISPISEEKNEYPIGDHDCWVFTTLPDRSIKPKGL